MPRYKPPKAHTYPPSIFSYLHVFSVFPAQPSRVCSPSGVAGAPGIAGDQLPPPPSPASRRHTLAAPNSLPCSGASMLAVQLAPFSAAFPKQPPRERLELRDPPSSLLAWLSISVQGTVFIRAIVLSFLAGCFSNSSTASFNSAFPVSSTELSWEGKL